MHEPPRILIADDQSHIVKVLMRRLQEAGYDVTPAFDGDEVLAQAQRQQPDLYILDVRMPKLNGYEVCERLRSNPSTTQIPVMLCSGDNDESLRLMNKSIELGAVSWLHKPFRSQELLEHVRYALQRPRAAGGRA